jgi:phosphoribosylformylglycinamidine (FGAM) synthase PurS component
LSFANNPSNDSDTHLVNAKVVEVTDMRVSVITSSGVEHVIAIDRAATKVMKNNRYTSVKDITEGDMITIDLDAYNPMKFAKTITIGGAHSKDQLAKQ